MHTAASWFSVGCVGLLLAQTGPAASAAPATPRRPNIVFLLTDDQRPDTMGCLGDPVILTPNLDRLAQTAVIFERCYATSPICMASRASMLTGMYEYKTGCNFTTGVVSTEDWEALAYPVLLRQAGYRLGYGGKWNIPVKNVHWQSAFDEWGGFEESESNTQGFYQTSKVSALRKYADEFPHVTRAIGAFGRDFIRNAVKEDRPFCLALGFKAPHIPYDYIDPRDQPLYADTRFPAPGSYGPDAIAKLPIQAKLSRQYYLGYRWDEEHLQKNMRLYYQLVSGMDAAVGMVLAELERQGVADNTVIIFSSDNGHFFGDHGLDDKVLPYEESARVPLLIVDPRMGAVETRRSMAVVGNIDFAPTMLDYAGVAIPAKMDGRSLKALVENPAGKVRDSLAIVSTWSWGETDHSRSLSVVTTDWKYIYWCYGDEDISPVEELFDLRRDPLELDNVASSPAAATGLAAMRERYDEHHRHWSENTVADPRYARFRTVFDRHIPWRQKNLVNFSERALTSSYYELGRKTMMEMYRKLVGKNPPTDSP